jgi:hypothetical protein
VGEADNTTHSRIIWRGKYRRRGGKDGGWGVLGRDNGGATCVRKEESSATPRPQTHADAE